MPVSKSLHDKYDGYYGDGSPSAWREAGARDKADHIVEMCGHLAPTRVLEIGAGEGAVLARLDELGFAPELHGVEISESGIDAIRGRGIPSLRSVEVFDGYSTSFETRSFDLVYLTHVLEHVEHPRRLLYEAARLAPHVFVEIPLEATPLRSALTRRDYRENAIGHINFYSAADIRMLVQSSGFRVCAEKAFVPSSEVFTFHGHRGAKLNRMVKRVGISVHPELAGQLITFPWGLLLDARDVELPDAD